MNISHLEKFNIYVIGVWICIWCVLAIQFSFNTSRQEAVSFSLAAILSFYPLTTYLSTHLLKKAIVKRKIFRFCIQFLLISLLMIAIVIGLYMLFSYLEKIGVFSRSALFNTDSSADMPNAAGAFAAVVLINFGFCGLRFFEENLKLHKVLIDSQLQILKAQINPHFMFNVLNHVNVLIKKEPDLASALLVQYTGILRYQLYSGERDLISLRQEVGFLKDFIEIEKIRWKNSLDVQCTWKIEDEEVLFPPLLIITLIENAFKHVSRSKAEKGYVIISLKQQNKEIQIYIENSKFADEQPDKTPGNGSGLGLENIKRRLEILYPGKYNLKINQAETVYSTTLKIQL